MPTRMVPLAALKAGDVLVDWDGQPALTVERVMPAQAPGYVVVQGTATELGRVYYPNGQTSGLRDRRVSVQA